MATQTSGSVPPMKNTHVQIPTETARGAAGVRLLFLLWISLLPLGAATVLENFDDGSDGHWTHLDPLAGLGVAGTGTWSVSNGAYRLEAAACQAPDTVGPGRAGALLNNSSYTDFYITMDLVRWDDTLDQIFGILARVSTPGLGTLNGYGFTYAPQPGDAEGEITILRITGEEGDDLAGAPMAIRLDPTHQYRMVFIGRAETFTGEVYDLADPRTPIATTSGIDATYSNAGPVGFFTYDNSSEERSTADITIDNFSVAPEQPPVISMRFNRAFEELEIRWPAAAQGFILQTSSVLDPNQWSDVVGGIETMGEESVYLDGVVGPRKFYRLLKP